ncbi:MAG: hypothetical protein ACI936_003938 [Paraglaciecola sp.]|jgi:hypothetical protein
MQLHRFGQCEFDLVPVVMTLISRPEWGNLLEIKRLHHLK